LLINGDLEAGFAGLLGYTTPLTTAEADQGWYENPNGARPLGIENGELILTDTTSTPEAVLQIVQDDASSTGAGVFSFDVLNTHAEVEWAVYGYSGDATSVDSALESDGFYTRSNLDLSPSGGDLLAAGDLSTGGAGETVDLDFGDGYDYLVVGIATSGSAPSGTTLSLLDNLSLESTTAGNL